MNAKEVVELGREYCHKHEQDCKNCPLGKGVCINAIGHICTPFDVPHGDFMVFAVGFTKMLDEIGVKRKHQLDDSDFLELHDRFGHYVSDVVRDMISGEGKRWEK